MPKRKTSKGAAGQFANTWTEEAHGRSMLTGAKVEPVVGFAQFAESRDTTALNWRDKMPGGRPRGARNADRAARLVVITALLGERPNTTAADLAARWWVSADDSRPNYRIGLRTAQKDLAAIRGQR